MNGQVGAMLADDLKPDCRLHRRDWVDAGTPIQHPFH